MAHQTFRDGANPETRGDDRQTGQVQPTATLTGRRAMGGRPLVKQAIDAFSATW